jgi:signal peptidase II
MLESIIVFAAVALDQLVKWWAKTTLRFLPAGHITLIPGVLEMRYVENRGGAFSLLWGKVGFLIAVSAIVIVVLTVYLIKYRGTESLLTRIAIAGVIGGAVGNLIDRVLFGYVVDMFNPVFVNFAIFNVADAFVTCGTILLVFVLLIFPMFRRKKTDAA